MGIVAAIVQRAAVRSKEMKTKRMEYLEWRLEFAKSDREEALARVRSCWTSIRADVRDGASDLNKEAGPPYPGWLFGHVDALRDAMIAYDKAQSKVDELGRVMEVPNE